MADEIATTDTVTTPSANDAPAKQASPPAATAGAQGAPAATPSPDAAGATLGDDESLLTGKLDQKPEADGEAAATKAAVPEAYEFTLPDGMTLDTEALDEATPVLKELKLTNEQANKLAPLAAGLVQKTEARVQQALEAQIVATRKAWVDAALADQEIGGTPENHETVKAVAARFLDRFAGPEFRKMLVETGLGNHPEMIRAAYRAGQAIGEDGDFVRTDQAPAPKPKAFHEKLYLSD
jgi:predicted transcriptional regulator